MAPGRFLTSPPAVPLNSLDMTYDGEGKRTRLVETPTTGSATTIDFWYQGAVVA